MRARLVVHSLALLLTLGAADAALAQGVDIKGYGMVGSMRFAAEESFDTVLGSSSFVLLGGGAEVGLPLGGLYVGFGAWQVEETGERVFISGNSVFPLGIPVTVTVTPFELTGGWRFKNLSTRVVPYAGGGWSSYGYKEESEFSASSENVDERFNGFHLLGGAEVRITRWLGVGGEIAWSTVPDALGAPGSVSGEFDETNLGGTSFRLKISVGR